MEKQLEQTETRRKLPKILRTLWQIALSLLWGFLYFMMFVWALIGLNCVIVGLVSFFVDFDPQIGLGPRLNGEPVGTSTQRIVFTIVGLVMGITGVVFLWLRWRGYVLAALIVFTLTVGIFLALGWTSGIHSISGGYGYADFRYFIFK